MRTQLAPAVVIAAPLSVALLACFGWEGSIEHVAGVLAMVGLHFVLLRVVRDGGGRAQERLWASWGASPTVLRLRWDSSDAVDEALREAVARASGVRLPTRKVEHKDPEAADRIYEGAIRALREKRRDRARFPRVRAELLSYGFARNLYGGKPVGVIVAAAVTMAAAGAGVLTLFGVIDFDLWRLTIALVGGLVAFVMWLFYITPAWVRRDADRYAAALLESSITS